MVGIWYYFVCCHCKCQQFSKLSNAITICMRAYIQTNENLQQQNLGKIPSYFFFLPPSTEAFIYLSGTFPSTWRSLRHGLWHWQHKANLMYALRYKSRKYIIKMVTRDVKANSREKNCSKMSNINSTKMRCWWQPFIVSKYLSAFHAWGITANIHM